MKKIVIETKISIRRVNNVMKEVYGGHFYSQIKRGQIYIYCSTHLSDEQLYRICNSLSLELVSKSSARAVLRH